MEWKNFSWVFISLPRRHSVSTIICVYVNGLVVQSEARGFGCRIHGLYAGCNLYADDIILLAHTSYTLQKMLVICNSEITALDLHFSVVKSVVMRVGPRWNCRCAEFNLGSSILKFVDNTKYLGIYMKAGSKFSCFMNILKLRFYSSFNALYRRSNSSHSELVSVQLLQSFYLPVILYGLEVTEPVRTKYTVTSLINIQAEPRSYNVFIPTGFHIPL